MADGREKGLFLPWQALLVAIPSFAVYELNDQLLATYGETASRAPPIVFNLQPHLESGARLEFLAAFIFFVAVAAAVLTAFVGALWSLSPSARGRIAAGVSGLTIAAAIMLVWLKTPGLAADIGLPSSCPPGPTDPSGEDVRAACAAQTYVLLLPLLGAWKWILIVATASVIFGAICCLATISPKAEASAKIENLLEQARRLNLFLFLSATLLVSALLVQLGFLRWSRFAIDDPGPFDAHVSAIILYYGVGYTVFLASYYVPVAYWLGRSAKRLKGADLRDEILKTATIGPAGMAKAAATILAPALAGLLTSMIDLLA
jgi:hypothetical protein